jgi:hypothetical protein
MKTFLRLKKLPTPLKSGLFCGLSFFAWATLHNTKAVAEDVETQLQGAWAQSDANCGAAFVSMAGKWKFREPRDMTGSGFIVSGKQYEGPFGQCLLTTMTPKDDKILLALGCHNSVGYSDQVTPIRLKSSGELELFFAGLEGMSVNYQKCGG